MKKLLNIKAGRLSLFVGFIVCIVMGYYIGVELSFDAFKAVINHE
jgi:hypothetical protein